MPAPKCPHCQAEIEGFVPQATFIERLKDKENEIKEMKPMLAAAQAKAKDFDAIVKERDTVRAELDGIKTADERREAFKEAGITEAAWPGFEVMYRSATADFDDDKRPTFTDWLAADDTKAHPLLAGHYAQPDALPTNGAPPKPPVAPPPKLDKGIVQTPETKGGIKTAAELQAYLRSGEFLALSGAEQKKMIADLKSKVPQNAG